MLAPRTDGAFFGELTVLRLGAGPDRNRHVYTATAAADSDCTFLTEHSLEALFDMRLASKSTATLEDRMRDLAVCINTHSSVRLSVCPCVGSVGVLACLRPHRHTIRVCPRDGAKLWCEWHVGFRDHRGPLSY